MEKIFRDYLRSELKAWVKEHIKFLKLTKLKLGSPLEGALIWEGAGEHGTSAYLILRFHGNRHLVTLDIAWEKTGVALDFNLSVATKDEIFRLERTPGVDDALATLIAEREHGWALQPDICAQSWFNMHGETPPEARLREMFEGEATRDEVREALFAPDDRTDWRAAKLWHTWDMLGGFLKLTEADAEYALAGTVDDITKALAASYVPYLEQCRRKA